MQKKHESAEQDSELRFSGEQGFFDKSPSIRLLIGFAFALSLFLFLHFREVRVEVLELNSIAPKYVVAQVDFEFIDQEATLILRQEAVRDIGKIYKLSEKQVSQRRLDFENQLLRDAEWRKSLSEYGLEEIYNVLDAVQKAMVQMRFSDPRTIRKMREAGFPTEDYQVYTPLDISEEVVLPKQIWTKLVNRHLKKESLQKGAVDLVINYFQKDKWRLEDDIPAQKTVRNKIQASVPRKYTRVSAGNRIIDQGERVTSRHIAMLQAMKKALGDLRNLWHPFTILGSAILSILITAIGAAFLYAYHHYLFLSNRKLCLVVTIAIMTMALAKGIEYLLLSSATNLQELVRYPLLVPIAAVLTCNLMNPALAIFMAGFLTVIFTMTLSFDHTGFMFLNLVAAVIAILSTGTLHKRKEIFVVCAKAWVGCIFVVIGMHLYANSFGNWTMVADIISSALFLLVTAIMILGLLPLLESAFHIMSDVTLTEYMDPNNEILRRLSFEAPGTYQHTLVVCNLAEAAAVAIGANGLFCRVASLYHDIGKMTTPHYFTENQQGEMNVHQLLTPIESAQTIMAHVSEGVAMARKAGLPEQFIDIIKEHHGTTLVYYFYRKQLEQAGGDSRLVDESEFRYSGPKPHSKESAIIMIADTFEAASRSIDHPTEAKLMELIDKLVRVKAEDGQFDECQLTFEELGIVKSAMVHILIAGMHSRIKYPERESEKESHEETPL